MSRNSFWVSFIGGISEMNLNQSYMQYIYIRWAMNVMGIQSKIVTESNVHNDMPIGIS